MSEYLWVMLGGMAGLAIAHFMKKGSKGAFFVTVIGGVAVLFLSIFILQSASSQMFQGLMITAATLCGLGYSYLMNQQKKFR